jgi:hypothetical protein
MSHEDYILLHTVIKTISMHVCTFLQKYNLCQLLTLYTLGCIDSICINNIGLSEAVMFIFLADIKFVTPKNSQYHGKVNYILCHPFCIKE